MSVRQVSMQFILLFIHYTIRLYLLPFKLTESKWEEELKRWESRWKKHRKIRKLFFKIKNHKKRNKQTLQTFIIQVVVFNSHRHYSFQPKAISQLD